MPVEELTIVFRHATIDAERVLNVIQAELKTGRCGFSECLLYGKVIGVKDVWLTLKRSGRNTFNLVVNGHEFHLGSIRNHQVDFLRIKASVQDRSAWDRWAARFIGSPDFVMAWLVDVEYDFWQNAEDLLQYEAMGRPYEHLPKRLNGLPPPLDRTVVDISCNPGRRILRVGYYEAIGSVMWLGELFWRLTHSREDDVEQVKWLEVSRPMPKVVRVEASPNYFRSADGQAAEFQHNLRHLLFSGCE